MTTPSMKELRKAAILMMNLEMEAPGSTKAVFSILGESISKKILREMSFLESIEMETSSQIVKEFHALMEDKAIVMGGKTLPDSIYSQTFPSSKGHGLFEEKSEIFSFIYDVEEKKVLDFLNTESNQVAALLFYYMDEDTVSNYLSQLSPKKAVRITELLLSIAIPNERLIWSYHHFLKKKFMEPDRHTTSSDDSVIKLARSFEILDDKTRTLIFSQIERSQKQLADKIKAHMLTFSDLLSLPEKDLQTILYEVQDIEELARALVLTPPELQEKVKQNVSKRLLSILEEELLLLAKKTTEEEVLTAQKNLIGLARELEKDGKIGSLSMLKKSLQKGVENDV